MLISQLEEKIAPELSWQKIEDIPDFPLHSMSEVKSSVEADQFTVGIDYTTSNTYATWLYGGGHKILYLILGSIPITIAIVSLVLVFVLGNYWLLFGVILGFAGQFLSNPYNPSKGFWKSVVGLLFFVLVYGLWQGKETMIYLSAFFIIPFFTHEFIYSMNQNKLIAVALDSETIFIYLYQTGELGLKDCSNGKSYWCRV
jgi:hypothetical protein